MTSVEWPIEVNEQSLLSLTKDKGNQKSWKRLHFKMIHWDVEFLLLNKPNGIHQRMVSLV